MVRLTYSIWRFSLPLCERSRLRIVSVTVAGATPVRECVDRVRQVDASAVAAVHWIGAECVDGFQRCPRKPLAGLTPGQRSIPEFLPTSELRPDVRHESLCFGILRPTSLDEPHNGYKPFAAW